MPNQDNKKAHKHREDLTGEHKVGDAGQLAFAILFFAVWIVDSFFLKYTTIFDQYVPLYVKIPLAVIILGLSVYLAKAGLNIVFGEKRKEPGVIRKGVFGYVRHPVYLGEILLYLGLLILSISLAAAAVWIAASVFLHFISRYEEKLLVERFGVEYEKYMKEVRMWIPRIWKKRVKDN